MQGIVPMYVLACSSWKLAAYPAAGAKVSRLSCVFGILTTRLNSKIIL